MEKFTETVQEHVMNIENDNGVHRCLYFARPKSISMHFRLITWPGHLAISGDMGDFMFARVRDMFEFFRGDDISTSYWGEKLVAISRFGGYREFNWDKFAQGLESYLMNEHGDTMTDERIQEELERMLRFTEEDEHGAVNLIRNWHHDEMSIDPSYVPSGMEYTYQYLWCIRAIAWGIRQYDAHKEAM